jgi:hypothetical protein
VVTWETTTAVVDGILTLGISLIYLGELLKHLGEMPGTLPPTLTPTQATIVN